MKIHCTGNKIMYPKIIGDYRTFKNATLFLLKFNFCEIAQMIKDFWWYKI